MISDEASDIFKAATASYPKINRDPTLSDIRDSDQKVRAMLAEMPRDSDGEECGILFQSQPEKE